MAELDPYAVPRARPARPATGASPRSGWARLRWVPAAILTLPVVANLALALGAAHLLLGEPLNPGAKHRCPAGLAQFLAGEVACSIGMGLAGATAFRAWCRGHWRRAIRWTTAYVLLIAAVGLSIWLIAD